MSFPHPNRKWINPKLLSTQPPAPAAHSQKFKWINPNLLPKPAVETETYEFSIDTKGEEVVNRAWRNPNIVAAPVPTVEVGSKRQRYWDEVKDSNTPLPKISRAKTSDFEERDFVPTPL
jgi:hypothetical protein